MGETVEVLNVRQFAIANGLHRGNLWQVMNGERQHHKGWRSACPYVRFDRKPYAIEKYVQ